MADSMKFGPEWLRNMNSEGPSVGMGSGGSGTPIIMAQFRYGREEMLQLFQCCKLPPEPLKNMQGLYVEKQQMPINFITPTEEENRMWNKGINSDASLRLSKPGSGPGAGMPGTRGALGGRGGSMDRGRGRARGSYHYSRGLSYEETDTSNGFSGQRSMRSFDRTQSQGNWNERNGGDTAEYTTMSPRKEFGTRSQSDTNWRSHRGGGEEDSTWRGGRSDKWGRGSGNSWRESDSNWDRPNHNNNHLPAKKPWENEENNLPEWATENPSESRGSFDASGAFHGSSAYSDDDDNERHHRSEQARNNTSSSGQPRPTSHSKKEPPNIPNGNASDTSSSTTSLKQSQSATSLSTENRPTNHPITTSASFSGMDTHASQLPRGSKPLARREESQNKQSSAPPPPQHQQNPVSKHPTEAPPQPTSVSPVVESKGVTKTSQEEEIEQRILNEAAQLMDEEEKDPPVSSATGTPPLGLVQAHPHSHTNSSWYYKDPQGNVQGPFQSQAMLEWYETGYFKDHLLVRRQCDERYSPLIELKRLWDGVPFLLDYFKVPPIKKNDPVMIDEKLLLQVHLQQQLLMQQRNQALATLRQPDNFNSLTLEQQQLLAHQAQVDLSLQQASMLNPHNHALNQPPHTQPPHTQPQPHTNANVLAMMHQLAQYQQLPQVRAAPPVGLPVPSPTDPLPEPLQQLMQQISMQKTTHTHTPLHTEPDQRVEQFINAFRQRQANPHTMESVWGGTNATPNFPGWSATQGLPANLPQSLWVDSAAKGIKTEQDIMEEQLRAKEKKLEELRKQEELQRLKEEEERQRRLKEEEELERRRKEEEEKEREKERKRLQEEERKKKEAAAAKKAEQDRLKKEEEKKRKEEEKRRKEEEKRRQEEEKKRAEEEKKRLEEERKLKEDMSKRQNEALRLLQEEQQQQARVVKPTPAPWTTPEATGPSLADIQKTERKKQQLMKEKELLKAYQEKHQQEQQLKTTKSSTSFKWAEPLVKNQPTVAKSLAEIQAEEHERMAKLEREKVERMAAAKDVPTPAPGSIWASAPQSLSWNTASGGVWGTIPTVNSGSGGPCFWDEVSPKATKPQQPPPAKIQTKTKAKKDEAVVMKLFGKPLPKTSESEEFNKWCSKSLAAWNITSFDIPTFVEFLLTFDSKKEIIEYIHMYLGITLEANNFATEFIERRSRLLSSADQPVRPEPPAPAHSNHFQEVKGKNKKVKKGKMTKVDSRILGFNVTAATDRINVGDRDYGENL